MTDSPPLRIGLLGAARITPPALIGPARRVGGVEVVAIAARDRARAEHFAGHHQIPRVLDDYRALLADPEIDAVYNPLPNALHAQWTLAAIEAGKHVLAEKPLTSNAEEARQVAAAAEASGLVVMEAFHWRYHPLARRLAELSTSGELGALERVESSLCIPFPLPGDIRYRLDLGGGATMDTGCYAIHFARTVANEEPTVLSARASLASPGVDRAMEAELSFPSGATGRVRCSLMSWRLLSIYVRARFEGGELEVANPVMPHLYHRFRFRRAGEKRWTRERFDRDTTYTHQLRAFRAAVQEGASILTPPSDSVANMEVVDAVYRAAGLRPRGAARPA